MKNRNKTDIRMDKGQCQLCKNTHNQTSIWKVFLEDGWFRGDDIYLGKFCKKCKTKENIEKRIQALGGKTEGEERKT